MKMQKKRGREKVSVSNSLPFSKIIFCVASFEFNFLEETNPDKIAKELNKDSSTVGKQLRQLTEEGYLISSKKEGKKLQYNKNIYSLNWDKIIGELLIQLRKKIENVLEEIKENHLDFNKIFTNFEEIISRATDKNFEEKIKKNKYLKTFLKAYFSYIAKSQATKPTISEAFSFLFYFENFNFIEEFEKENLKKDSDLEDLFLLEEILKVVKFKPSLKIGLGEGVISVRKELVKNNLLHELEENK